MVGEALALVPLRSMARFARKEERKKKKEEWWAGHPHPIYITIHLSALHPHPFAQGMNEKACIYTIFKVITQSEILALSFIRAKRNECECLAHHYSFLFLISYFSE